MSADRADDATETPTLPENAVQIEIDTLLDQLRARGINTNAMLTQISGQVKANALTAVLIAAGITTAEAIEAEYQAEMLKTLRGFFLQIEQAQLQAQRERSQAQLVVPAHTARDLRNRAVRRNHD